MKEQINPLKQEQILEIITMQASTQQHHQLAAGGGVTSASHYGINQLTVSHQIPELLTTSKLRITIPTFHPEEVLLTCGEPVSAALDYENLYDIEKILHTPSSVATHFLSHTMTRGHGPKYASFLRNSNNNMKLRIDQNQKYVLRRTTQQEVKLLLSLSHPNIIRPRGLVVTVSQSSNSAMPTTLTDGYFLILDGPQETLSDFMERMELREPCNRGKSAKRWWQRRKFPLFVNKNKCKDDDSERLLCNAQLLKIAADIAGAVSYMHDCGVAYNNLSPEKIAFVGGTESNKLQLIDFSSSNGAFSGEELSSKCVSEASLCQFDKCCCNDLVEDVGRFWGLCEYVIRTDRNTNFNCSIARRIRGLSSMTQIHDLLRRKEQQERAETEKIPASRRKRKQFKQKFQSLNLDYNMV